MNLPVQHLAVAPDLVNKALEVILPPGREAIFTWAFRITLRQNLLALTIIDDAGNPTNYRLAAWRDEKVQYDLKNTTQQVQMWYLTGWEVYGLAGGSGTLDDPGDQDSIKSIPSVQGTEVAFLSETPYYDGADIHPGDTLVTVKTIFPDKVNLR